MSERGDSMAEDLKILQKIFDMMEYGYSAMRQFPKSEKYALATDIKRCMDNLLGYCIEAQKKYYKKTTLEDLDIELETLRNFIVLASDRDCVGPQYAPPLSMHQREVWSRHTTEIGKMIGGYKKSIETSKTK